MKPPLDGLRILDMTIYQNGPWGTVMLSDMGAEVIKIEDPVMGDPGRKVELGEPSPVNTYFETMNRNKKAITLNLKTPEGREVFYTLARKADAVTQNFRVGVVENLGVDYETVRKYNPKIVYASVSGLGHRGPDARDGVFDILGLARGGLMAALSAGEPEITMRSPGGLADQMGAVILAYGVLLGIIARDRHGVGQHIEVSQLGGQMILQALAINAYLLQGARPRVRGRMEAHSPIWNVYKCADGRWIALGSNPPDRFWPLLCRAMELEHLIDDPRACNYKVRAQNAPEIIGILDGHFLKRTRQEWLEVLKSHGIYCTPVQDYEDLVSDPQVVLNEYLTELQHDSLGTLREVGVPVKLTETPGAARSVAPEFGQHTEEVLLEHGYTWDQIGDFRAKGII